jgi:hypothetical protein
MEEYNQNMAIVNLRKQLKKDFGVDLQISGGLGQSIDDPIVIDKECRDWAGTEHLVIGLIYTAYGKEYKTVETSLIEKNGRMIDKIQIEVDGDLDRYNNYYFDITSRYGK